MKSAILLLTVLLVVGGLHFVRPNRTTHGHFARLAGPIGYAFNADSPAFARLVIRFPKGFVEVPQGGVRILRPLYPTLGWVFYQGLRPLRGLVPGRLVKKVDAITATANHPEIWAEIDGRDLVLAWAALVAVNILLCWLSLMLIHAALSEFFPQRTSLLLALVPALHFDTIDFLYVPGLEAFNLLVPAIFLHAAAKCWPARRRGYPAHPAALGLGIAMLGKAMAYPVTGWLYELLWRRPWRENYGKAILAVILVAGPYLGYVLFLWLRGLPVYNHEVTVYRQVVWMADYAREGRVLEIPLRWAEGLWTHLLAVCAGFFVPWAMTIVLLARRPRTPTSAPNGSREEIYAHLAVYTASCAAFWCLVGYHQPRLAVTQYPAVIFALGVLAVTRTDRPDRWIAAALILTAVAHLGGAFAY